jgi:hypothetical protein
MKSQKKENLPGIPCFVFILVSAETILTLSPISPQPSPLQPPDPDFIIGVFPPESSTRLGHGNKFIFPYEEIPLHLGNPIMLLLHSAHVRPNDVRLALCVLHRVLADRWDKITPL